MEIDQKDKEHFARAYQWLQKCNARLNELRSEFHQKSRIDGAIVNEAPVEGEDPSTWNKETVDGAVAAMRRLGEQHQRLASHMRTHADALEETNLIAARIIAKLEAQVD